MELILLSTTDPNWGGGGMLVFWIVVFVFVVVGLSGGFDQ